MITYPVDVENTRWAVLKISTGEIVSRRKKWPRADGGEIVGLDPDFAYLLHVDQTPPDYDSRLYALQGTETVDVPENALRLEYAAIKRPLEDQISAAENEEAARLSALVKVEREVIETRLMVGAILAYIVDNQQFPPKVRTMATAYKDKATRIWQNRDRLDQIIAAINAGEEPDLDSGWDNGA